MKTFFFEQLNSTNDYLKRFVSEHSSDDCKETVCCCAFSQTSGRGRNGRSFSSGEGGLYISFLEYGIAEPANITLKTSVRILKILEDFFNIDLKIKWVNDIVLDGRKCVGILVESGPGYCISGIGINVFNAIPEDLKYRAVSILGESRRDVVTERKMLCDLADRIIRGWSEPLGSAWMDEYRRKSSVLGSECELYDVCGNKIANGIAVDFAQDGSIVLDEEGVLKSYLSGELLYSLRSGGEL
ncbi:MAG TPA: biotin--[acetyl-CoA-carboxylase] ligase [Spirochaetaceae bacterium]|nr:biotin--[acetyl-CoA-carboxylase] ligase [Spirochaetaceae bacterium]